MFIDEIIQKGDFVGIHWRYDLDDWLATNCKVKDFQKSSVAIISIYSNFLTRSVIDFLIPYFDFFFEKMFLIHMKKLVEYKQ